MMRVVLAHDLGREALRERMIARLAHEAAQSDAFVGAAAITTNWISDYQLTSEATAMGFTVLSVITIEDSELVFEVEIPAMLGFARGMIENMVREKGAKLLK